jgi:site-specific DNA-adenine methylase
MKTKSALSYFGSDSEVAPQLGAMFDNCKHVTIAMVGGASIIPYLKARAIVANDLHDLAINFYRVLSGWYGDDMRQQVIHRCHHTLSHPSDIEIAQETIRLKVHDHVEKAWAFWALCWIGRKGKGGTKNQGGMPSVRRTPTGGTNASRVRAAAEDLPAWAKHFERCEWESCCFRELLPKVADNETCGIYCDPPWVDAGKLYLYPFVERDHRDMRQLLGRFALTTVVVRYGDAPLIRELYADWHIIEAESRDQCNAVKGELWITNKAQL